MVVASPYDHIKSIRTCFPLVGCFPYLGFFNKTSAKDYAQKMEDKGFITWLRPIYAYSTLGYFTDPILSSFFHFDKYTLASLIFHELFHTIFFIENMVEFNENLANYFGSELTYQYFAFDKKKIKTFEQKRSDSLKLRLLIIKLIKEFNTVLLSHKIQSKESSEKILAKFLKEKFYPQIENKAKELLSFQKGCPYLKAEWNNASMAVFLTYNQKTMEIDELRKKLGLSLKEFYFYLKKQSSKSIILNCQNRSF